ncbi:MAG: hypothetical protein AB7D27_01635 [Desulfomicrobium sp.]
MLGSLLPLAGRVLGSKWLWVAVLLLGLVAALYIQDLRHDVKVSALGGELAAQEAQHAATRSELAESRREAAGLRVALDQARNATEALQGNVRAALVREAQARADAEARKAIISAMRTRERTEAEAKEVVDDATRHSAATRLNRPW